MLAGELRLKAITDMENNIVEITGRVEHIMEYIKGSRGKESDKEILDTVDADIEELWKGLS